MSEHKITLLPSLKRVRAIVNGKTVADTLRAMLLVESGAMPVYYFPRRDVAMDRLERTDHHTHCPYKGDASYWSFNVGGRKTENAAWSYEQPLASVEQIAGMLAFDHKAVDHWFEEDEEVFGHPRDPHHRVDVRPSTREVRVVFGGETIALTRRALFLFETGLPTRYYIPPQDVRQEFLLPMRTTSICPYKGQASYWSIKVGDERAEDAVWAYMHPLPECPRIAGHFCFYPERVQLSVEGEPA
jgi:uncharacterized protein (DUF427 family)